MSPVTGVFGPVQRELRGAETHTHHIEIPGNRHFRIEVVQQGVDVAVELSGPDGQPLMVINTPVGPDGTESLLLDQTSGGRYRLAVRSLETPEAHGSYRLTVQGLVAATEGDDRRLNAERAMTEAGRLNYEAENAAEATEELWRGALTHCRTARAEWRGLGMRHEEARALYCLSMLHYDLLQWTEAAEQASMAAALFVETGNDAMLAASLHRHGQSLIETQNRNDFEVALTSLSKALEMQQSRKNRKAEGQIQNTIGSGYLHQGDLENGREHLLAAYDIFGEIEDGSLAMVSLGNMAVLEERAGNLTGALETYRQALTLTKSDANRQSRANILSNMAVANAILGNLEEALLLYEQAAKVFEDIGDRPGKARTLTGIGSVYGRLGKWQQAVEYYQESLALQAGPTENPALVRTHITIGNAYRNLGELDRALDAHNQALSLAQLPTEEASAYLELGRDRLAKGDESGAQEYFDLALASASAEDAKILHALALQERGSIRIRRQAEVNLGLQELEQALAMHRSLGFEVGEAQTLHTLARGKHLVRRVDEAVEHASAALEVIESMRKRVGNPHLRLSYTGLQRPTYELQIALLMELHGTHDPKASGATSTYQELALEVSERARARSFVELLSEAKAARSQGIDPELVDEAEEKQQILNVLKQRLERAAAGNRDIKSIKKRIREVIADLDRTRARIRRQNPQFAELTQPAPLRTADIQRMLAPSSPAGEKTLLIEYALGDDKSFVWMVTDDAVESRVLPGRFKIENAARNAYESLRSPGTSRRKQESALMALSDLILPRPIDRLVDRVVIVPDGALHYIPFGVLPVAQQGARIAHLVERYEIVTLSSASALVALRKGSEQRDRPPRSMVIFADPVFSKRDPRMVEQRDTNETNKASQGEGSLRLPFSDMEAEAIGSLLPAHQVLKRTGFEASRSSVLTSKLNEYRWIHFATHGRIDAEHPELSLLEFSTFTKNGTPQTSRLTLSDIYGLRLNAELVVLSACETGLGADIRGEGLVGLTRGFMYAGASRVLSSLWRVSDRATAQLMKEMYRLLLEEGMTPAAALRLSQLEMLERRRFQDPYYWAGFMVEGGWR